VTVAAQWEGQQTPLDGGARPAPAITGSPRARPAVRSDLQGPFGAMADRQ